jgi:hypothetical protein
MKLPTLDPCTERAARARMRCHQQLMAQQRNRTVNVRPLTIAERVVVAALCAVYVPAILAGVFAILIG